MKKWLVVVSLSCASLNSAHAMELDWSGQFWSEFNWVHNYTLDSTDAGGDLDPVRDGKGGYYIRPGGSNEARWEDLFMRLRPKLVVNDNIYIKSEWWVGDPIYGIFGDAAPYTFDQKQFYSTQSRGSAITAQRFWGEFVSDFGTVQLGRVPLQWGMGLVWNSGDNLFDHYQSTGDALRLISKFGAFSVIPSFVVYDTGNSIGGACVYNSATGACMPTKGTGVVRDYSLIFKYENPDEDFEGGVNFIRRLAGASQDAFSGFNVGTTPVGMTYNTWDIYGQKKLGKLTLTGELPIVSGDLGGVDYKTYALAADAGWKFSEIWDTDLRFGHAPGQQNEGAPGADTWHIFYFNPDYHVGMIMFNYAFQNFAGPATLNNPAASPTSLASPYDNPIVDANYFNWGATLHADKWDFRGNFVFAKALETAKAGQFFFNNWSRSFVLANADQESSLGWEMDYGTTFHWDEYFQFRLDFGFFFPGGYYKFSNVPGVDNMTSTVFATSAKIGVAF